MSELKPISFQSAKDKADTYKANIHCQNCGESQTVQLPKGMLIPESKIECKNCGCSNEQLNNYFREQEKNRSSKL